MNQSNDAPLPLSVQLAATPSHEQLQSPLFTTLFPELRTIIFTIALTEYDDKTRPYSKHSWCYRPGFTHAGKISTGLLATCRRVVRFFAQMYWLEGRRALRAPRLALDFARPGGAGVFEPRANSGPDPRRQRSRSAVESYASAPWAQPQPNRHHNPRPSPRPTGSSANPPPTFLTGLSIRKVALTIRHSDWWYWEQHQPLRMDRPEKSWGAWIGSIPGIEVLELELETIDAKKAELEGIVRGAVGWRIPLNADGEEGEGWVLVHDGERPRESMWLGTSARAAG
ncbi:hypothetical protein MKEN_00591700 [Mycena kentingensis (nom. inval.)]|nr:hypothetical protein MKEN_00591700 [Mycena kentingensis (nom. inval.)]